MTEGVKEVVWLSSLVKKFGLVVKTIPVNHDIQSAIYIAKNPISNEIIKYIDVKLHFIRDIVTGGNVEVLKIATTNNLADMYQSFVHKQAQVMS